MSSFCPRKISQEVVEELLKKRENFWIRTLEPNGLKNELYSELLHYLCSKVSYFVKCNLEDTLYLSTKNKSTVMNILLWKMTLNLTSSNTFFTSMKHEKFYIYTRHLFKKAVI